MEPIKEMERIRQRMAEARKPPKDGRNLEATETGFRCKNRMRAMYRMLEMRRSAL